MSFVSKVAKFAVKYGKQAVDWVWRNKAKIIEWGYMAYTIIKDIFG